ncbi:hypothetical protein GCM10027093_40900 [Paraburkholderia jirisanensis]
MVASLESETVAAARVERMDAVLARLLAAGTWLSCALIAAGLVDTALADVMQLNAAVTLAGPLLVRSGIAAVIALPVVRVATMAFVFARNRELRFFAVALSVLAIIAAGLAIGIGWHAHVQG